jgi:DnaK suppressor protein
LGQQPSGQAISHNFVIEGNVMATNIHRSTRAARPRQQTSETIHKTNPSLRPGASEKHKRRPHSKPSPADRRPHEENRRTLLALRQRLRGNLRQIADNTFSATGLSHTVPGDAADLASDNVEQSVAAELLGTGAGALQQIDAALKRLEEGTYGQCAECRKEIPAARLEALPYATLCVQCAARQEQCVNANGARGSSAANGLPRFDLPSDDTLS